MNRISCFIVMLAMMFLSACHREKCYTCYYYNAYFYAIKSGDTLLVNGFRHHDQFIDSLDWYKSMGYMVNTVVQQTFFDGPNAGKKCGTDYENALSVEDSCVFLQYY